MISSVGRVDYICARCLQAGRRLSSNSIRTTPATRPLVPIRRLSQTTARTQDQDGGKKLGDKDSSDGNKEHGDEGAMSKRLREMSEEALESGTRSARKAVSEAGFSDDLKKQLEERIASSSFRAENRNAFVEAELPSHAGRGTRDIATADPWSGEETLHDVSLRMLTDSHKPLREGRRARMPGPAAPPPQRVDTGRSTNQASAGTRLAHARERSGMYASLKESDLDEQERQKRFQALKDRFSPHARSIVPGTIQGLSSLANERIEDAIARGQFKNLPRGQKIERDYNASSPFLDTTEYFLNKIIQKQEIVPPWIEKQQELVSTTNKFRARLRNDWKRHAARMIASTGGTLTDQIRRAEAYAKAEMIANPNRKKTEQFTTIDEPGQLSQISLSGELKVPPSADTSTSTTTPIVIEEIIVTKTTLVADQPTTTTIDDAPPSTQKTTITEIPTTTDPPTPPTPPAPHPFRDPTWQSHEQTYHTLAINDLNNKTRSYNLQAPSLAKKPYFSLQRELDSCYADVAPQLAEAIRERATGPRRRKVDGFGESLMGKRERGVMERFAGERVRVRDERVERRYGFRQFWRELWGSGGA